MPSNGLIFPQSVASAFALLVAHCITACGQSAAPPDAEGGSPAADAADVSTEDDARVADGANDAIDATALPDRSEGDRSEPLDHARDPDIGDVRQDAADQDPDGLGDVDVADGAPSDTTGDDRSVDATVMDAPSCGDAGTRALRQRARAPSAQIECTPNKPCPPGLMCLGGGCDDVWCCMVHADGPEQHPCPTEMAPYCGCDGVTFFALYTCPDRPYERVGACEEGVSCDPTDLLCSGPEPPCPEGFVRSVVRGRYDVCVAVETCRCEFVWECPQRDKYACDTSAQRCRPIARDL
jgi:hypothetical protein